MPLVVDNCFIRVYDRPDGITKAAEDIHSLFIVIDTVGEKFIVHEGRFFLPHSSSIATHVSLYPANNHNTSFLGWLMPPYFPQDQLSLSVTSALRPGLHAIFTVRLKHDVLLALATTIGGSTVSTTGITSLCREPGAGALLHCIMLAKFIDSARYCVSCGKRLAMRDEMALVQVCEACNKEYFLPTTPYVCGIVSCSDAILLTKGGDAPGDDTWHLPLFELEVCDTPLHALNMGLYDLAGVNMAHHTRSVEALNLTVSIPYLLGLASVYQLETQTRFKIEDNVHVRWFTKTECADLLKHERMGGESLDGFFLREWLNDAMNKYKDRAPSPFDKPHN